MPVPDPQNPKSQHEQPRRRDHRLDAKPPSPPPPELPALTRGTELPEIAVALPSAPPRKSRRTPVVWAAYGTGAIATMTLIGWLAFTFIPGKPAEPPVAPKVARQKQRRAPAQPVVEDLREAKDPVTCRINTPEPGFVVFIDDQPIRDKQNKVVHTPCEIDLEPGTYSIRVSKKGWTDLPKLLEVTDAATFDQTPTYEPFAETQATTDAPYLEAPVGKPILLKPLVFKGRSQDPYVSASGREIWYAAAGPEGMGIYFSTRASPYHEWDAPSLLLLSRGADMPASPSATEDTLQVAYTVPGKVGRVWGLSRKSADEAFDDKKPLHFLEQGEAEWPSAQLSANGKRLYYLETRGEKAVSWMTTRYERDLDFGKGRKLALPGGHACLSVDELRQYIYDGKRLLRATRSKLTTAFSTPQLVMELEAPGYVPHPERRQFWVTDDEQWLYYAENPAATGNLYVVRLRHGPARGVIFHGRSLKPEPAVVAKSEEPGKPETPTKPANESPEEDPLSLPTPYARYLDQLVELLSKRNTAAAAQLIAEQLPKPELQAQRQLIEWDSAEVDEIQKFWKAAEASAAALKADDTVRFGGTSFTLEKYAAGIFTLKTKAKSVERKLNELSAGDLLALVDKQIAKDDAAGQLGIGIFLHYEGKPQVQASKLRLERAGSAGADFQEHLAVRKLKIIEQELARENLGVALGLIDALAAAVPKSPSAEAAEQLRSKIYSFVKWTPRGNRTWELGADSSYTLSPEKESGSMLVSSTDYDSFDLTLEWQVTTAMGQGGVFFRYPGQGNTFENAFKVQLANDAGVAADKFCTGSLFNYAAPSANAAKPGNQWNTLAIQVRGEKVVVHVNGQKVQDILATSPDVPKHGFVALDGQFGGIIYRKVLLVEGVKAPPKSR